MTVRLAYAFIDVPRPRFDAAVAFWAKVSESTPSRPWGGDKEFTTLEPAEGDPYLALQAVGEGGGNHLDLYVQDLPGESARIQDFGATLRTEEKHLHVLDSPGGLGLCLTDRPGREAAAPTVTAPGGATSRVDQMCIDIPQAAYDHEVAFWRALTRWQFRGSDDSEFERLNPPDGQPVQLLLQRLDEPDGPVRAHLDLASSARDGVRDWHVSCGAEEIERFPGWTVMRDPAGTTYCITTRAPD